MHILQAPDISCHFAGGSGTGRTTFVNTLCESEVLPHKDSDSPETAHVEQGVKIKPANVGALMFGTKPRLASFLLTSCLSSSSELEEDGIRIALTIVDTPGFGDNIDNEYSSVTCCLLGSHCTSD